MGPDVFACRACDSTEAKASWTATERMFGTGEAFNYGECAQCGSLSLQSIPADLHRHYPSQYGPFTKSKHSVFRPAASARDLKTWLVDQRSIDRRTADLLHRTALPASARILDVGCGRGDWLVQLWDNGYVNVQGIDAYIPPECETTSPFVIRRGTLGDITELQDLISYHHVLEHTPNLQVEIASAVRKLRPGGFLLVRIPVADCWARRVFDTCWYQWDAPRHLCIPTRAALRRIAMENNLKEVAMIDDSTAAQVWASRRYRANLTGFVGKYSPLSRRRYLYPALPGLIAAKFWTKWLNTRSQGDQVSVLWQRPRA